MQAPRRYPVGVQSFNEIRTKGYLYVDKTAYMWDLINMGGKYRFLSRPRRFGKTLLVSTLEAYFRGRRELFEGLAIHELDEREEWPAHPVIRLDLSSCKSTTEEGLARDLDTVLRRMEDKYGRDTSIEGWSPRIEALIKSAYAAEGGENGVVVLVDEYDAPLLTVMHDPERLQRFREVMREFYSPLKANEDYIAFLLITGVSKFSQLSIFSELNNLNNVSMLPRFGGICGITADELDGALAPDVAYLAGQLGVTSAECRERLRRMYDGYRFSKEPAEIYNPFSLVTALSNGDIGQYWFSSGTPTSLVNMLRESDLTLPELEGVEAGESSFDAPAEAMNDPVAFMYQSGYLTIKGYDPALRVYTLGIPNAEVGEGLSKSLLPLCVGSTGSKADGFVARFSAALLYDCDMDAALTLLRSFLAGIPYDLAARREKDFQAQLYLILKLVGASVATEVRTATGRIDAVIDAPGALFVVEMKYRREGEERPTSADAAVQVDSKGYLVPWQAGEKPVVKVGVVYSQEARTIDEDWVVEQA